MITIRQTLMPMALLAAAALTACGGGGGGGNDGTPSTPTAVEKMSITADNYDQVISKTGSAASQASSSGRQDTKLAGVESHVLNWSQLAQAAINSALARQGGQTMLLGAAQTQACAVSGNMSINIEGAGADNTLAVGEVITVDYSACVEEQGSRLDGRFAMRIDKLDKKDISEMSLDFSSFKGTDSTSSETVTGAMKVIKLPDLYVVNSSAFNIVTVTGGVTQTEAWTKFLFTNAESSKGRQVSFGGVLVSSELGNKSVEVSTPDALTYIGEAPVPNSGKILIKGANNSVATLTVNSETSPVTIAVDANGDGTAEKSKNVEWNQIVGDDFK